MIIRQEQPQDYNEIYDVVQKAFASAEHSDGNEQDLVTALRKSNAYIPELSLVAVIDNKIIGHIMFTKVKIQDRTELALAPLSVLPEYQKKGVGKSLINHAHKIASSLGYNYSVVLGSEIYYPKSGYVKAENYNIKAPFEVPSENFMVCVLKDNPVTISGTVEYAKEFFEL